VAEPADHPPELDALTQEALDWVVLLKSGSATVADGAALQSWRQRDPAHEAAFRNAVKLWNNLGATARELADAPRAKAAERPRSGFRRGRRAFLGGAIAASAAGCLIARPPFGLWPSVAELSADYRTGKGEMRHVVLAQYISFDMNTLTSIAVRSASPARLELIAGEATIASQLTLTRPLVVIAGDGRITAADATFNARCIDGAVAVACVAGEVEVEQHQRTALVRSGMQVSYSARGLEAPTAVDPDRATAWHSGLLIFDREPLAQVVDEVNRYRPGKIIVTEGTLGSQLVSGTFHRDRLDDVITQFHKAFGARVTTLPGGLVLLS